LIKPKEEFVSITIDLSRLEAPLVQDAFPNIYLIGKEIDLLECLRRTEEKEINFELLIYHGMALGISRVVIERVMKQPFVDYKMLRIDNDEITLLYSSSDKVYDYGLKRLEEISTEKELLILDYIERATKKPVTEEELGEVIDYFERHFRENIEILLVENSILRPFDYRDGRYFISPRMYKDEDKFRLAYEVLEDNGLVGITDFLRDNPGNPQPVVQIHLGADGNIIDILNQAGIIDPMRLNVEGDVKSYLYSSDLLLNRKDKDHFDLVKMTLANFRFGEYYSKIAKLRDLEAFFSSMLDRGYAGKATPIGTDYKNLELAGIVRVRKVNGGRYRFWMLKKDVIEDVLNILKGYIPIKSSISAGNLNDIENIIRTRSMIRPVIDKNAQDTIIKAIRQIQEAIV